MPLTDAPAADGRFVRAIKLPHIRPMPGGRHGSGVAKTKVARKIRTHRIGVDGASA